MQPRERQQMPEGNCTQVFIATLFHSIVRDGDKLCVHQPTKEQANEFYLYIGHLRNSKEEEWAQAMAGVMFKNMAVERSQALKIMS